MPQRHPAAAPPTAQPASHPAHRATSPCFALHLFVAHPSPAEMLTAAVGLAIGTAVAAGVERPAPVHWALYPSQSCGGPSTREVHPSTASAKRCAQVRTVDSCRAACHATDSCTAFDTTGRLFLACGSRVGGEGDLYLQTQERSKTESVDHPKIDHFVVLCASLAFLSAQHNLHI